MAVQRTFVSLPSPTLPRAGHGSNPCQGLWWTPAGTAPTTALLASHYNIDFAEHYLAQPLAERGFGFLGWNTRYRGNEAYFVLEHGVVDIGVGVRWLQEQGVEQIVLLGNSGGGSLMAAYQSQALEPIIRPAEGRSLPDAALDLPVADLFVSLNAHLGRPDVLTAWLDPSVVDERDPLSRDPHLDMYDAAHGPPYAPAFVERYRAAQVARNAGISAWARAELARLGAAGVPDTLFALHRVWADLRFTDLTLDPSDREAGCYAGDPQRANAGVHGLGRANTCRSWLSMWSLEDSQCRAEPHLRRITQPSLLVQSLADTGIFPSDARALFDAMGADDKSLELVAGDHYFSDRASQEDLADLVATWLRAHGG